MENADAGLIVSVDGIMKNKVHVQTLFIQIKKKVTTNQNYRNMDVISKLKKKKMNSLKILRLLIML